MAHSYLGVKRTKEVERLCAAPDGAHRLYMYFFNEVAKPTITRHNASDEIYEHYHMELLEVHTSWMDARLEDISENSQLRSWYLAMLLVLESRLDEFGENIDNSYLNQVPELVIGYREGSKPFTMPVAVSTMKNFINDIRWVLNENGIEPSGQFKCFEINVNEK